MSTPNYLIDKTPLLAIQYDLQKQVLYGANARLGLLKIGTNGGLISMIQGGLPTGWRARKPKGQTSRFFDVLLLAPVTTEICNSVVALQVNGIVFEKVDQTPWEGETPAQWVFECNIQTGSAPVDLNVI